MLTRVIIFAGARLGPVGSALEWPRLHTPQCPDAECGNRSTLDIYRVAMCLKGSLKYTNAGGFTLTAPEACASLIFGFRFS